MDWIWQNLFSSLLWEIVLLLIGGGLVLAWIKTKWPQVAASVMYGLAGVGLLSVLVFVFTGHAILAKQPQVVTPDNLEAMINQWSYSLGLGVQKPSPQPGEAFFLELVTLKGGNQVTVLRAKELPDYVQFSSALVLSPEHQKMFDKLSQDEKEQVSEEVILELARSRIGNAFQGPPSRLTGPGKIPLLQNVLLMKSMPIDGLTKEQFVESVDYIDSAIILVKTITALALKQKLPILKLQ